VVSELSEAFGVIAPTTESLIRAMHLAESYGLSFWDAQSSASLPAAAAVHC